MLLKNLLPTLLLALLAIPATADIPIEGRVVDADGRPLEGAEVRLLPRLGDYAQSALNLEGKLDAEPVAATKTDARGGYLLHAPEIGMWNLEARADGRAAQRMRLEPLSGPAVLPDAVLSPARSVSVRVMDGDGSPIAGAMIYAVDMSARQGAWRGGAQLAVSDAEGRAAISQSSDGALRLRAAAPGFLESADVEPGGGAARVVLERGRMRVLEAHGADRQSADRQPLAGVIVHLGDWEFPAGRTDENGRLVVALPSSGKIQAELAAPDGRKLNISLAVDPDAANAADADAARLLTLPDLVEARGRVLDGARREPVADAIVWIHGEAQNAARTDARGRYILRVDPRDAEVWVRAIAEHHFDAYAQWRTSATEGPTLVLDPATRIAGVVVDTRGEPVAGATITPKPGLSDPYADRRRLPSATSAADGRFLLRRLDPLRAYTLTARAAGFAPVEISRTTPELGAAPADAEPVRFVLGRGMRGVGAVLDLDEEPVAGARVRLHPARAADPRGMARRGADTEGGFETTTFGDGTFVLENLPAGRFDLRVEATGFAPLTVPGVEIPELPQAAETGEDAARELRTLDLGTILVEPGAILAGRVVDPDGAALAGVEVRVGPPQSMQWMPTRTEADTTTDADGRFLLPDRKPGEIVDVHLQGAGHAFALLPRVMLGEESADLRVVLEPVGRVSGRVVDEDGRGIPGATLNGWRQGRDSRHFFSTRQVRGEADGSFAFAEAFPGEITLRAEAPGHQTAERTLTLAPGRTLDGVDIVLLRGAVVVGRVWNTDGEPAVEAIVGVRHRTVQGTSWNGHGRTDGEGRYRLDGVPLGRVEIVARDRHREVLELLDVEPGENALDLRFAGGVEVSGWVRDADGEPVAGALVTLHADFTWRQMRASSRGDGSFRFEDVTDGFYHLQAVAEGWALTRLDENVDVDGASIPGLEIRLRRGGAIVGRLEGVAFEDLEQVALRAYRDRITAEDVTIAHDGTYRIDGLMPGDWRVVGQVGERSASGEATLAEGAEETRLDLNFAVGATLEGRVLRSDEPVVGLEVQVSNHRRTDNGRTDHRGGFRFTNLEPGTYEVWVGSADLPALRHRQSVEVGEDGGEILIELVAAALRGRITDAADGAPLDGVEVLVTAEETTFLGNPAASSDADGLFRLEPEIAEPQTLILHLRREGYVPTRRQVEITPGVDTVVDVALEAAPGLTLDVRRADGGRPSRIVAALLDASDQPVVQGTFDASPDGLFRITSAPTGAWRLLVSTDTSMQGGSTIERVVSLNAAGEVVSVILPPSGRLRVRTPGHDEIYGLVQFLRPDGSGYRALSSWGHLLIQWPMQNGRLRSFGGLDGVELPAGTWTVRAELGLETLEGTVVVTPGGEIEFVLE